MESDKKSNLILCQASLAVKKAVSHDINRPTIQSVLVHASGLTVATDGVLLAFGAEKHVADYELSLLGRKVALVGKKILNALSRSLKSAFSVEEDFSFSNAGGNECRAAIMTLSGDGVDSIMPCEKSDKMDTFPEFASIIRMSAKKKHDRRITVSIKLLEKLLKIAKEGRGDRIQFDLPEKNEVGEVDVYYPIRWRALKMVNDGETFGMFMPMRNQNNLYRDQSDEGPVELRLFAEEAGESK